MARRERLRREAGAGPVMALMVLAVFALLIAIVLTGKFAVAGDERSDARHAADAAALGGAQAILDELPDQLSPGFLVPSDIATLMGGGVCVQTGRFDASRLAAANGATLTSYCYNVFRDEVSTSVRMNSSQVKAPGTADAVAATTFDASSCTLDSGFKPPTTPPADDDGNDNEDNADDPPPPPSSVGTSLDCGTGALSVVFRVASARFGFVGLAEQLADVKPRLTR